MAALLQSDNVLSRAVRKTVYNHLPLIKSLVDLFDQLDSIDPFTDETFEPSFKTLFNGGPIHGGIMLSHALLMYAQNPVDFDSTCEDKKRLRLCGFIESTIQKHKWDMDALMKDLEDSERWINRVQGITNGLIVTLVGVVIYIRSRFV